MSVTASPAQTTSRAPFSSSGAAIESCPVPILALTASGAVWLFIGTIFGLIDSLKFHNPHILAGQSYLTYGRIHAAHTTSVLYGFGIQAALAVGLWLLTRLGRTALAGSGIILIGMLIWNTAVTIGIAAILCGGSTGFDSLEMPGYVSNLLLIGYLLIAVCGMLTFHNRAPGRVYPSEWFVLGSFFWFPWIFTTASMLLLHTPVRGVVQSCVAWWFAHNLSFIVLGFAGLAPIFYFIPKLLGRALHSYYLAVLAFWMLALFGSWGGIPAGAPLPSWIISMCVVGAVLTLVPTLAVVMNLYHTVSGKVEALDGHLTLRFTYVALFFWAIASVQRIVGALPSVSVLTDYSWYWVGYWDLFHYGFFAFAMFGAIYYIVPRLLDPDTPPAWSATLVKWHFGLMLFGVLISTLALIVAGVGQGILLNNLKYQFVQTMQATMVPLHGSTLGDLFIMLGSLAFLMNLAWLLANHCRRCCALSKKEAA